MRKDGKPFITVYAICKNEAKFVDRWADSMLEADAVVVLDTGSTDDTVEKLRARGITVKVEVINPWRFDVARNKSLDMCPEETDLYLCTDLDEILEPGWAEAIREQYEPDVDVYWYLYTWSHDSSGGDGRVFWYNKMHKKGYAWQFPVHEALHCLDNRVEKVKYLDNRVHLHHYPDQTKSRGQYLPLLELREKEYPDDWYGRIYLAHEYRYSGQYQKSIDKLKEILIKDKEKYDEGYLEEPSCYLFIGDNYRDLGEYDEAIKAYGKAISLVPTYREPYLGIAKTYLDLHEYGLAEHYIREALKHGVRAYSWLENDASWSHEPYDLLCQACWYGGKHIEAIASAAKAAALDPKNQRLQDNLQVCLALTQESEW